MRAASVIGLLIVISNPTSFADVGVAPHVCRYDGLTEELTSARFSYPVGTFLRGRALLDLDGDGLAEKLGVRAQVQWDYAMDLLTRRRSDERHCWFTTRLTIRAIDRGVVYSDRWSVRFDDMAMLLLLHGTRSPVTYYRDFFSHEVLLSRGIEIVRPDDSWGRRDDLAESLAWQGIAADPDAVLAELRTRHEVPVLTYRASWREDVRLVAYVPSLRRAVAVQIGY
jgi:hypothetical protein